ncbi:MAG TPA: ribosome small subunit-dependent GTPase A [Bauldia sp.]|nr:ribosome small subunit-dependent GTPase A [Bauldia sp.]
MTDTELGLAELGWSNHFAAQVDANDLAAHLPARVVAVHRGALEVTAPGFAGRVPQFEGVEDEGFATVGDFLLLDATTHLPRRLLARRSLFKRKAAGSSRRVQLIAANVDTLLVVTSCNQDFNIARLERYLALAREAEAMPLVVITKADLADDSHRYVAAASRLMPGLFVECLDARDPVAVARLTPWCGKGQTVALLGSSGVGKSTLVNTLTGEARQAVSGIREDDSRGRHTTTGRSMHRLAAGGWLIDTPGMRELQLADVETGIADVFADIADIAARCRFADCRHESEPGCAVRAAIDDGTLDPDRLRRYRKLAAEDARNSASLRERRARERGFGRMVRSIMKAKDERWDR